MKGCRTNSSSGFDPKSIPGCALWLDAADQATLTLSGTNVTQWNDKSGNGRNATAGIAATYSSTERALNFALSYYSFTNFSFAVNSYFSFFLVERVQRAAGGNSVVMIGTDALANNGACHISYFTTNSTSVRFGFYNNDLDVTNTPAFTTAAAQPVRIWSFVFTASFRGIYLNGTLMASDANNTQLSQWTTPYLGRSFSNNSNNYTGFIYEVLGFGGQITSSQRQAVEGYLARKWGLQASTSLLPIGHPYKYGTPGFVPTSISGCALWLDAADSSTLTFSGSSVTAWRDKSSNAYSATNLGTITTTTQNGVPALNFGNNRMTIANFAWNTYCSVYIVARSITYGNFLYVQVINNNEYTNFVFTGNWTLWQGYTGGSKFTLEDSVIAEGTTVVGANQLFCFGFGYGGGTAASFYRINGTARATKVISGSALSDGTTIQPLYINGRWDSTVYDNSIVCEILHYNGTLTTAQQQQVEGYLAWKWGTRTPTLPATHPYVSIPPVLRQFAPVDIPGCALWLDAADSTTLTLSGSNVTTWVDKSGNGRNAVGNIGTGTYSSSGLNSLPTIQITPSGNMVCSVPAGTFSSGISVFVVFQKTGANNSVDAIVSRTTATALPSPFDVYTGFGGPGTSRLVGNGSSTYGSLYTSNDTIARTTTPTIWGVAISSATPATWVDFTNGSVATYTLNVTGGGSSIVYGDTATAFHIGTRGDNFTKMNGNISEIIAYSSALTTTQRQAVEGYLARKWGLQSTIVAGHPYRFGLPALTAGFTPVAISGCALWLDAADRTSLTLSGSNVTQWNDKSGNSRNASAQVAATYSSTSNALSFTGSNYYSFGNFSFAVGNYFSFFIVERLQSSSGQPHILGTDSTGANQGPHVRYNGTPNGTTNASTFRFGFFNNDLDAQSNIPAFTTAGAQPVRIWSLVFTASFRGIYLNGTLLASDTNNTFLTAWNTPLIGRAFVGINPTAFYYNGFLYEILGFGGQITTAQRQQIEGYLAWKWGLQGNLPVGHPYRSFKP